MGRAIEDAWQDIGTRFEDLKKFVELSGRNQTVDRGYTQELYSSWVLMTYAAHESAYKSYGDAVMQILADVAETPAHLPEVIRATHQKRTLQLANEIANGGYRGEVNLDLGEHLSKAYTKAWVDHSVLMRLDRNAWVNNIREWLSRLGLSPEASLFLWMREPWPGGSETLASLVDKLVRERNDIAHGGRPVEIGSPELVLDWISSIQEFSRNVKITLQIALATNFQSLLDDRLGEVDLKMTSLAPETVALSVTDRALSVEDYLLARDAGGNITPVYIKSMRSENVELTKAESGSRRVAVSFNRPVVGCDIYSPF